LEFIIEENFIVVDFNKGANIVFTKLGLK